MSVIDQMVENKLVELGRFMFENNNYIISKDLTQTCRVCGVQANLKEPTNVDKIPHLNTCLAFHVRVMLKRSDIIESRRPGLYAWVLDGACYCRVCAALHDEREWAETKISDGGQKIYASEPGHEFYMSCDECGLDVFGRGAEDFVYAG